MAIRRRSTSLLRGHPVTDRKTAGSSLKFCLVAEGEADIYPRFGRTMEWDTAAGQAVLTAAGGQVTDERWRAPRLWQSRLRKPALHRLGWDGAMGRGG